nr:MAG TPA: hypothetical protein [Herelleviridae sp.]
MTKTIKRTELLSLPEVIQYISDENIENAVFEPQNTLSNSIKVEDGRITVESTSKLEHYYVTKEVEVQDTTHLEKLLVRTLFGSYYEIYESSIFQAKRKISSIDKIYALDGATKELSLVYDYEDED